MRGVVGATIAPASEASPSDLSGGLTTGVPEAICDTDLYRAESEAIRTQYKLGSVELPD